MENTNAYARKYSGLDEMVISDPYLVKAITDACLKVEPYLLNGLHPIGKSILNEIKLGGINKSGIDCEIITSRPHEGKPIIFEFKFRTNMGLFEKWCEEHVNMLEGPLMVFICKAGLRLHIQGPRLTKFHNTWVEMQLADGSVYSPKLIDGSITIIAHRELINDNAWIIKVIRV
jgi:hypothetical protein